MEVSLPQWPWDTRGLQKLGLWIQLKFLDLHGRGWGIWVWVDKDRKWRGSIVPGASNLVESVCSEKIRPSGCLDSSRCIPTLTSVLSLHFPLRFQPFFAVPCRQWDAALSWPSLWRGGGLQRGFSTCSWMGIATPVTSGKNVWPWALNDTGSWMFVWELAKWPSKQWLRHVLDLVVLRMTLLHPIESVRCQKGSGRKEFHFSILFQPVPPWP